MVKDAIRGYLDSFAATIHAFGWQAVANLKEATQLYLEESPVPEVPRPLLTTFEVTYG